MYNVIGVAKFIFIIVACILLYKLLRIERDADLSTITNRVLGTGLRKIPNGYFSYERLETYLKQMGKDTTPTSFIMMKIGFSILAMIAGIKESNILIAAVVSVGAFFIPDYLVKRSNENDNEEFLVDLKRVYDTLRIQTKSGVHISDALSECYLVARNSRLKEGLLNLSSGLKTNKDIEIAIQDFNDCFKNSYIDSFCIIIKQGLESGKTVQVLEDLSEQISDIEEAMYLKDEEKVASKLTKIQFLIYIGVISIIVYGLFSELMSMARKF